MRFTAIISVDLDSGLKGETMNDWADYAVAKLQQQRQNQRLKDEKVIERQRIKRSLGVPLWNQVRQIAKENAEDFNKKIGEELLTFEVTQNSELRVRFRNNETFRVLHAVFDSEGGILSWQCEGKSGSWEVSVTDDGGTQFRWSLVPTTPGSIVKQMFDALLFD
jgi:hypothetical protein